MDVGTSWIQLGPWWISLEPIHSAGSHCCRFRAPNSETHHVKGRVLLVCWRFCPRLLHCTLSWALELLCQSLNRMVFQDVDKRMGKRMKIQMHKKDQSYHFFRSAENIPTGKSNHRRMLKADWLYNGWHRRHMPMIHWSMFSVIRAQSRSFVFDRCLSIIYIYILFWHTLTILSLYVHAHNTVWMIIGIPY